MRIVPRRATPPKQAAHQEHSTPEIETETGPIARRRMTITVDRETVSVRIRRPVAKPENSVAQSATGARMPEPQGKRLPAASPELRNALSGNNP
jgi:hypothetical protein